MKLTHWFKEACCCVFGHKPGEWLGWHRYCTRCGAKEWKGGMTLHPTWMAKVHTLKWRARNKWKDLLCFATGCELTNNMLGAVRCARCGCEHEEHASYNLETGAVEHHWVKVRRRSREDVEKLLDDVLTGD